MSKKVFTSKSSTYVYNLNMFSNKGEKLFMVRVPSNHMHWAWLGCVAQVEMKCVTVLHRHVKERKVKDFGYYCKKINKCTSAQCTKSHAKSNGSGVIPASKYKSIHNFFFSLVLEWGRVGIDFTTLLQKWCVFYAVVPLLEAYLPIGQQLQPYQVWVGVLLSKELQEDKLSIIFILGRGYC